MSVGNWDACANILIKEAKMLQQANVDFIIMASNTVHKVAEQIKNEINIPLLHIADTTAEVIKEKNYDQIALLGTIYTMEENFYKDRLIEHQITPLIPDHKTAIEINRIIFEELCLGKALDSSKQFYREVVEELKEKGAQGVILGCTEINLLLNEANSSLPTFDTTKIHVEKSVELMLAN